YENQAYHYFATSGNTDLARVVQYTALYQLFIDNEITYSGDVYTAFPAHKPTLLKKPASNLMEIYKNLTPEDIHYLSDTSSKLKFADYQKEKVLEQLRDNEQKYDFAYTDEQREKIFKDVINNGKRDISNEFYQVRSMLLALSDEKFQQLAKYVACPRCTRIRNAEDYNVMLKGKQINKLTWNIGKNYLYSLGVELSDVKNYYVNNLASSSGRYVKTPSVIITYNDFLTTGGHNLSSKISRVKTMTNYKPTNYTPEDYKSREIQPANNNPVSDNPPTVASKPATPAPKSPAGTANPTATASKPTTTTSKPATPAAATKPATRPRSEVISTAPRQQRGF
ncbi:MAG: hypothetical protein FWE93_07430, partial [Alphaproteobacteria bacterium]|nr:hypothetical protein [Alphaproteobacteria bacterium]